MECWLAEKHASVTTSPQPAFPEIPFFSLANVVRPSSPPPLSTVLG